MNPRLLILPLLFAATLASGQSVSWSPSAGFVYPAGAQRGTTTTVFVGGRALGGAKNVRVSGEGVEARIVGSYRSLRNMSGDQRKVLQYMVRCRRAELTKGKMPEKPEQLLPGEDGKPKPESKPPKHPLVELLPTLSLVELKHWEEFMRRGDRLQPARHLEETVHIEIVVSDKAAPGTRELRLLANNGLSNPLRFQIGTLTEHRELEPNENPETPPLKLPCLVNGQVQPGDIDRIRFHATRGQKLIVHGAARTLIPYLADAVPGWFQMGLAVKNEKGEELAYADHFRHHPDPVLALEVPEDGIYTLEIRDSIYRGRDDFVYRVAIGELPLIGSRFPLGGQAGKPLEVELRGWNLKHPTLKLDTAAAGPPIRDFVLPDTHGFRFEVGELSEMRESEPNNDHEAAQAMKIPAVANGRIDPRGDADIYRIEAKAGQPLAVEVVGRRLGSPLDAVVHVAAADGQVIGWNDDRMSKDGHLHLDDGLLTHHADPSLTVEPVTDGPLWIRVADTRHAGGPAYGYRLRVTPVEPDFELRVSPSGISTAAGKCTPLSVHVRRRHGFDGEIRLALADGPKGATLSGGLIPAGADGCRLTLDLPAKLKGGLFHPKLTGTATLGGKTVTREALPTDDRMQAFLWRHLVPAGEWVVQVRGQSGKITRIGEGPIELPAGGSAVIHFKTWKDHAQRISTEPSAAPVGLTVSQPKGTKDGFTIKIQAPPEIEAGERFNLIVDLYPAKNGVRVATAKFPHSSLPALPILIISTRTP